MADRGHELTDAFLKDLEEQIAKEYAQASRDMQRKWVEYMERFAAENAKQKALLDAGKITEAEYGNWRFRHMMMGKRWEAMKDVLAADMQKANEIALRIAEGGMADVYCLNADFATYQIEHAGKINTGYTLYNHDAAERLLKSPQQMMPGPSTRKAAQIAADKTMQWNKRKIQSAVLQGILQGESPYKIAERLRSVATMNYNASVRYARTMTTNAQNAGRYDSFRRANKLGVDLTIEWQATLDGRTRHEHRMMHGQRREVDEPFVLDGVEILYPAQSSGPGSSDIPQSMIWNCRCTLLAWVKGFEGETVRYSPKMGDMSFGEWLTEKADEQKNKAVFSGTNVTQSYKNRSGNAVPKVILSDGYISKNHGKEISFANWLSGTLGGEVTLLSEGQKKTPDFLWSGGMWELKSPTTTKAIDYAVREGLSQIADNAGGIFLNFNGDIDIVAAEKIIEDRMKRCAFKSVDIAITKNGTLLEVLRYKKEA